MAIPAILLLAAACAGNDITKTGPDASDLTASAYLFTSVSSIKLAPATATIPVGGTVSLVATLYDSKGKRITSTLSARPNQWASSDSSIATISPTGVVKGLKSGVVTVGTYTSMSVYAASKITVGAGTVQLVTPSQPATAAPAPSAPSAPTTSTTSTPPVTTLPSAPSSQQGPGLSGKALVYDDFTKYADTKALMNNIGSTPGGTGSASSMYTDGANANLAEIDGTVLYNGHKTMKYNQPGGMSSTPELWTKLPKTLTNAWFRFKIRYSSGWSTVGTTPNCANAYKIFGWNWEGFNGRGNIVFTNTDEYQVESYVNVNGSAPNFTYKGGARQTTEWSDGRWYDYIINTEQLDASRVRTRWWFAPDGQTPVLKYDITSTLDPKYGKAPPVAGVMVGINFNSQRTKSQALWYGQWEVVDGSQYANPFNLAGI